MSTPPAGYPSSIYSPELLPKEHVFLLYAQQIYDASSPQVNQKPIGGSNVIYNWPVYDGPARAAKLVARLQGIFFKSYNAIMDLVFTDERYPSTLKIAGYLVDTNELAIVGGTGQFALAQGFVKARHYEQSQYGRIRELEIHAMLPTLGKPTPVGSVTKDGPWGGNGGQEFDPTEKPLHLESVTIGSGDVVDSLAFSYIDQAGNRHTAGPWGGDGGLKKTIQLAPTETVKKIVGTTGEFAGQTVVTSMSIATNLTIYGPFGKEKGDHFNTSAGDNIIVGFYGRAGLLVHNLGVYVRKN